MFWNPMNICMNCVQNCVYVLCALNIFIPTFTNLNVCIYWVVFMLYFIYESISHLNINDLNSLRIIQNIYITILYLTSLNIMYKCQSLFQPKTNLRNLKLNEVLLPHEYFIFTRLYYTWKKLFCHFKKVQWCLLWIFCSIKFIILICLRQVLL